MYKPEYKDKRVTLYCGDSLKTLEQLPDESVNMCVTSPPYWGLRDYLTATWEGGNAECNHQKDVRFSDTSGIRDTSKDNVIKENTGKGSYYKDVCPKCGAKRIDQQLGLEKTPEEYVDNMVNVFREVKRVLRDDGTLWLNLGDSYAGSGSPGGDFRDGKGGDSYLRPYNRKGNGLKPKDLCGIPWRVAFALQADGWYLRQDIIWAKPNPMPESVNDRCTKSHEYIFMLTKSAKYYYDIDAIREPFESEDTSPRKSGIGHGLNRKDRGVGREFFGNEKGRNKRSVWTIPTKPFAEAHFAVFPPDLIIPCILAGCPEGGIVLDPFFGSGTTGVVAKRLLRNVIGIDLNKEYCKMAIKRLSQCELF